MSNQQKYENQFDDPDYQRFVEEMAKDCRCTPLELRPCDGVLAGGVCDGVHREQDRGPEDDE